MGTPVLAPLGRAGMVLIFTVFMLLKREDLRNRLLRLAGLSQLNLMTQALDDASGRVSRYLLMQFLVNAGFGALFGLGLYCIGVPYAPLWGVVAGILRYVPYVGTLICGDAAAGSLAGRLRRMAQAAAGVRTGGGPRTDRRQLHRTLALRHSRGDLFPGAAGDCRLLDRLVGARGPDPIHSADGLCGGSGALFPATLIPAYSAGR